MAVDLNRNCSFLALILVLNIVALNVLAENSTSFSTISQSSSAEIASPPVTIPIFHHTRSSSSNSLNGNHIHLTETTDSPQQHHDTSVISSDVTSTLTVTGGSNGAANALPTLTSSSSILTVSSQPPGLLITAAATQITSTTMLMPDGGEIHEPPIAGEHEMIGSAGPDKRELDGIQKALDWLKEKRAPDYGWSNDTHMVILSKELSGARDPTDPDDHLQIIQELEDMLSVKVMEIEILTMLDRHHALPKPLDLDKLARYVLALASLCKDPKQFYGHDLVATLQHHEPVQDNEFALTTLAACSSAAHVRKRQIRRLLDIASGVTDQSVDTIAMVILALRCIVTDHRHRHLQHFVRRPARGLASLQDPRGSFGSLRSTALAMQALQDLERDPAGTWNRSAASKWILDRQRSDGGWAEEPIQDGQDPNVGVGLTADIILALGWKGLGAVRALQCDHVVRESSDIQSENGDPKLAVPYGLTSSAEESDGKNVSYTYTLWVGTNVTEAISLSLVSQKNTSFYRAMTQAAEIDPRFTFEARVWPNGHYVHTLAGKKEEPRGYNYWLLYRLPEMPDPNNPPGNQLIAPVGVDELMVEDGEHYLYWYKKL